MSVKHSDARALPGRYLNLLWALRKMDVMYCRLENRFPKIIGRVTGTAELFNWNLPSVWEFNTIAEFARMDRSFVEHSQNECSRFQRAGRACDLA